MVKTTIQGGNIVKTKISEISEGLSQLRWAIKTIAKAKGRTELSICSEIALLFNKTGETIEDWIQNSSQHKWSPLELYVFTEYCLFHSGELNRKWVEGIFSAFGFSYRDQCGVFLKLLNPSFKVQETSGNKAGCMQSVVDTYLRGVASRISHYSELSAGFDILSGFFIHSRLERFLSGVSSDSDTPKEANDLRCEQIIFRDGISVVIGLPGSGKTTLLCYLVDRLSRRTSRDLLAIPINLADTSQNSNKYDLLLKAIYQSNPDLSNDDVQLLAIYLDERLKTGTAILIADNWSLSNEIGSSLRGWKKILLFSRQEPMDTNPYINYYRLPELSDLEIRLFVKSWLSMNRIRISPETLLSTIFSHKEICNLARHPIFLRSLCTQIDQNSPSSISRWKVIRSVIIHMMTMLNLPEAETSKWRDSLAKFTLSRYTNMNGNSLLPHRFSLSDLGNYFGNIPVDSKAFLSNLFVDKGLLIQSQCTCYYSYPWPEIQYAMAADALLMDPFCLQLVAANIHKPPWTEVVVLTVSQLAAVGNLRFLSQIISSILNNDKLDAENKLILVCKCLIEVDSYTRSTLFQMDIGNFIRSSISEFYLVRSSISFHELDGLLPLLMTEELEIDLLELLSHKERIPRSEYAIIKALGKSKSVASISMLGKIANNEKEDYSLAAEAINSLGESQNEGAIPILQSLLIHEKHFSSTVAALIQQNSPDSANLLLSIDRPIYWDPSVTSFTNPHILPVLIKANPSRHKNVSFILYSLASIGTEEAIDVLERFLYIKKTFDTAAQLLSNLFHPRACSALIRYARNPDNPLHYRSAAIEHLPGIPNLFETQDILDILFPAGNSPCLFGAKIALIHTNNFDTAEILISAANRSSADRRSTLVNIMVQHLLPELIPLFRELTNNSDHYVKDMALFGLSELDTFVDPEIILRELQYAVDHNDNLCLDYLCAAAGNRRIREATPILAQVFTHHSLDEIFLAVEALVKIGGRDSLKVLLDAKAVWWEGEGRSFCIHNSIFSILGLLGEPDGIRLIIECGTDQKIKEKGISTRILKHLGNVKNPAAQPVLVTALSHSDPEVRFYSAIALAHMGCDAAIPRILELLHDEVDWVGDEAFTCLTRTYDSIRNPHAIGKLVESIYSKDYRTKLASLMVIRKIPANKVPSEARSLLRKTIETEPQDLLFNEAVFSNATIGKRDTCQYYYRILLNSSEYPSLKNGAEGKRREIFFALGRIDFLPFLIDHLPETEILVRRLSREYGFRVLSDKSVVLSDGQELSANDASAMMKKYSK